MSEPRILMFEDNEEDADAIFAALATARFQGKVEWLPAPADFEAWPSGGVVAERHALARTGYRRKTELPFQVLRWSERLRPQSKRFYQEHFSAAILDVYYNPKPGARRAPCRYGEAIAQWLDIAHFLGPVVLTSAKNLDVDQFAFLPKLSRVSKYIEGWAAKVVARAVESLKPGARLVGGRGRNPIRSGFRAYRDAARLDKKMNALWVGADTALMGHVAAQFAQRMTRVKSVDPAKLLTSEEKVVWLDVSETTDGGRGLLGDIASALDRYGDEDGCPRIGVLLDRHALTPDELRRIEKHGMILVNRSAVQDTPGAWLEKAAEKLVMYAQIYRNGGRGDGAEQGERRLGDLHKLLQSLLAILLVVSTTEYVVGEKGRSFVHWFSSHPFSGGAVNTTLRKLVSERLSELVDQGIVAKNVIGMLKAPR